jgi:hypothetical protein
MKMPWNQLKYLFFAPLIPFLVAGSCDMKIPPKILSFTATPNSLTAAGDVKLEWQVENATEVSLSPDVGVVNGTFKTVNITSSKTFTLTAKNTAGTDRKELTVSVTTTSEPLKPVIDPNLKPDQTSIPGPNGSVLPVAASKDATGVQSDFVSNQVIVIPKNQTELDAFLQRYDGKIVSSNEIPEPPTELGISLSAEQRRANEYTVEVNTAKIDSTGFVADAAKIELGGTFLFSSNDGLKLLALVTKELAAGVAAVPNYIAEPHQILLRTQEQPTGTNVYDDAFQNASFWGAQDPRDGTTRPSSRANVAGAWQFMAAHRQWQRVQVAILDDGFWLNETTGQSLAGTGLNDFPQTPIQYDFVNNDRFAGGENTSNCGIGNPCVWHGNGAASVATGILNNRAAAAGTGGQVSDPMMFKTGYGNDQTRNAMRTAMAWGAEVVNMSFGGACNEACRKYENKSGYYIAFQNAINAGVVLVASAGNSNMDVNATNTEPCMISGVICVGALNTDSNTKINYSNFGAGVDIWAPANNQAMYSGSSGSTPTLTTFNGTSSSGPFVAGIAAMLKALKPGLTSDQLLNVLRATAWRNSGDLNVSHYVNALAAVKSVAGDFQQDLFEPNNNAAQAIPTVFGQSLENLTLHSTSDQDWFRFAPTSNSSLTLNFSYPNAMGEFSNIQFEHPQGCGVPTERFQNSTWNARSLRYDLPPGASYLKINDGFKHAYTLQTFGAVSTINADRAEPNENLAQASDAARLSDQEATLHTNEDQDYYLMNVPQGSLYSGPLTIITTFNILNNTMPLNVTLYRLDQRTGKYEQFAQSSSLNATDCDVAPIVLDSRGLYKVRIAGTGIGNYAFGVGTLVKTPLFKDVDKWFDYKFHPGPPIEKYLKEKLTGIIFERDQNVKALRVLGADIHTKLYNLDGILIGEGATLDGGERIALDSLPVGQTALMILDRTEVPAVAGLGLPNTIVSLEVESGSPADTIPPSITLSSNTPGPILSAQVLHLTADAQDNDAIRTVEFYENDILIGVDEQAPFTQDVAFSSLHNGSRNYVARAIDFAGNENKTVALNIAADITNNIFNPGAEAGEGASSASPAVSSIPGWVSSNAATVVKYDSDLFPSANIAQSFGGESRFFSGGIQDTSSFVQVIDIANGSSAIDAGKVSFTLNAYLGGNASQEDNANVSVSFLDSSGTVINGDPTSPQIGPVSPQDRNFSTVFVQKQTSGLVPANTRSIRVTITMNKFSSDPSNDGYVDNIGLGLYVQ